MNFQPLLAAKVMASDKTVTRRLVSDNPRSPWSRERAPKMTGRDFAVCPGRGKHAIGRVRVNHVDLEWLHYLRTDTEARREGFENVEAFVAAFTAINGSYDPNVLVWRIAFEVVT